MIPLRRFFRGGRGGLRGGLKALPGSGRGGRRGLGGRGGLRGGLRALRGSGRGGRGGLRGGLRALRGSGRGGRGGRGGWSWGKGLVDQDFVIYGAGGRACR